jgi:hypothetical protein
MIGWWAAGFDPLCPGPFATGHDLTAASPVLILIGVRRAQKSQVSGPPYSQLALPAQALPRAG